MPAHAIAIPVCQQLNTSCSDIKKDMETERKQAQESGSQSESEKETTLKFE